MTNGAFPSWIVKVPGTSNYYHVDPDIYNPQLLGELGVAEDEVTQYWLEVAFGCMKFDFDVAVRLSGELVPNMCIERHVLSGEGRKGRWNITGYPGGDVDWRTLGLADRSREIRKHYKRIRGFVPS